MIHNSLVFYACGNCGTMSMKKFRDDYCLVCLVAMDMNQIQVYGMGGGWVEVRIEPAPHTDSE